MEQIIIQHADGTNTPLCSRERASAVSRATQKVALLADDYITLTVSTAEPLPLEIGDTVSVHGRTYKLNQLPEPTKTGERRYTYEIRMEGLQYDLIDRYYLLPEDAYGETYYSDLAGHLKVLLWNINRDYSGGTWVLGECPDDTDCKNITCSGKNCLQALQELCESYDVEFDISTNGTTHTIDIKAAVGRTLAISLQYGRGKGLYSIGRTNVNNSSIVNRLYAYGSGENLGTKYGHTIDGKFYPNNRLCLPGTNRITSYIEDTASIKTYGVKEGNKDYSDIKPERIGTVTALGNDEITFVDSEMFDLNALESDGVTTKYLIDGTSAKIKFESGELAGYEFDLHSYTHATHTFVINRFQDENGLVFPGEDTTSAFRIAVGDKYSILDIQLPQEYIDDAESRLAEKATAHLPTVSQPQVSYKVAITESFFTNLFGTEVDVEILRVGDIITIIDEEIGVNKAIRITAIDRDILKRHSYELTLSDTVTRSTTSRTLNDIEDIKDIIYINGLADPAKARRRWMATQELLNMVFDPEGDYYSEKIKPLSIETQMLSVGAKSTQFTLLNVTFQPNYGGNYNSFLCSDGVLAHYAIDDSGVKYWDMVGGIMSGLVTNTAYYLYARCSRSGTSGVFVLSTTAITVEAEADYYNFLLGVLNSAVTDGNSSYSKPSRLLSLTYGSTTINGRFIRTGRIESSGGGSCYFDLDNNEIGGVIHFVNSNGEYTNVADTDDKASEAKDYINNTLPGILDDIQGQLDGQIKQFFYDYDPTLNNLPASEWSAQEKEEHLGDLFYNTTTGAVFRFVKENGIYKWQQLADEELALALALASEALATAQEKRRIFVTTPKPPYEIGDLWVQGSSGYIYVCVKSRDSGSYSSGDWEVACCYTDDSALTDFINDNFLPSYDELTSQIDGKIETWFTDTAPQSNWTTATERAKHVGDMWYRPTYKTLWRYIVGSTTITLMTGETMTSLYYTWSRIYDQDAIDAYEAASAAQDTADGKRTVFVSTPTVPYYVGDLWAREYTDDGVTKKELWRCITQRTSGSYSVNDWAEAVWYDNTQTVIDGGIVTSGTVQLAGSDSAIKAGITGNGTADSSVRIWAGATYGNRTSAPFRVLQSGEFIATNGTITGTINANSGSIGGWDLSSGRIGATATNSASSPGSGLSLYDSFIKFGSTNTNALLGCNVLPATTAAVGLLRLTNSTSTSYGYNYGALIEVTNAAYNLAIKAKGAILSSTYICDHGEFHTMNPSASSCSIPGTASPQVFKIKALFTNSSSGIGFPTYTAVNTHLGQSSSAAFAVKFTLIVDAASTATGYLIGRNSAYVSGIMDTAYYPYRLDNAGATQTGKLSLSKGDIAEYLLVWDGSNYYAYCLNVRT